MIAECRFSAAVNFRGLDASDIRYTCQAGTLRYYTIKYKFCASALSSLVVLVHCFIYSLKN